MVATIDAAALCKMADRGQITGGLLDGPLAFDNAISRDAARIKGIVSEVAGDPDILLVPDLEAGNMLAKQLSFLANADSAGLVLGARVPIILTSRCRQRAIANRELRRRHAGGPCASGDAAGHGVARIGVLRMDDYTVVINAGSSSLKFCIYAGPKPVSGASNRAGRSKASALRRASPRRTAPAPRLARHQPRRRRRARRPLGARCARRLAALDLRRRPGPRRRTPRRPRRPAVCRADDRHAAGARRAAGADPARAAPSAAQPRGD